MSTGTATATAPPATIADLFAAAATDDAAVDADNARLAADQQTATLAHQGLATAVTTVARPVVVIAADGTSATILTPGPGGTVTATAAVLGTMPIPATPAGNGTTPSPAAPASAAS